MNSTLPGKSDFPRWEGTQRRIGITGGFATGKSIVGDFLKDYKSLPIIDADIYAREALEPNEELTQIVINRYGKGVQSQTIEGHYAINRKALSKIIFAKQKEKLWLEKLIHPQVINKLDEEIINKQDCPIIILIIPLLFEAQLTHLCSEIWVITCEYEIQLMRLMARDCLSKKEAVQRIQSQWPLEYKKQLADFILDNNGKVNQLINQVEALL